MSNLTHLKVGSESEKNNSRSTTLVPNIFTKGFFEKLGDQNQCKKELIFQIHGGRIWIPICIACAIPDSGEPNQCGPDPEHCINVHEIPRMTPLFLTAERHISDDGMAGIRE